MRRADRPAFAIPNNIARNHRGVTAGAFAVRDRLRAGANDLTRIAIDLAPTDSWGLFALASEGNPEATPKCNAHHKGDRIYLLNSGEWP